MNQIDISLNQSILDNKSPSEARRISMGRESLVTRLTGSSGAGKSRLIAKPHISLERTTVNSDAQKDILKELKGNTLTKPKYEINNTFDLTSKKIQYEEGKAFFRDVRKLLSFEKFNNFMQQIKLLNKGQRSKEEVIKSVEILFGKENEQIIKTFKQLMSSNRNANRFINMK